MVVNNGISQAHGATVLLLGLMTTAVPALLVAHCLARVPLLRDVELVGGAYFPSVSTASRAASSPWDFLGTWGPQRLGICGLRLGIYL